MATGDLLHNDGAAIKLARVLIPPEDAAAEALEAYLRCATFYVHAGEPPVGEISRMRNFRLAEVSTDWPAADAQMEYPSATIIGADDTQHTGSGTPRPMDELWDPFAGTVPWLLGTATGTFQVDFWSDSAPVRQAIAARLPGLFSPSEARYGILLELPPTYLSLTARYSLITKGRLDNVDSVWGGQHRLRAVVRWEAPDVELRVGLPFRPSLPLSVETAATAGPILPPVETT
jgi:hypothetical protein